jgi:hypothetical protein
VIGRRTTAGRAPLVTSAGPAVSDTNTTQVHRDGLLAGWLQAQASHTAVDSPDVPSKIAAPSGGFTETYPAWLLCAVENSIGR